MCTGARTVCNYWLMVELRAAIGRPLTDLIFRPRRPVPPAVCVLLWGPHGPAAGAESRRRLGVRSSGRRQQEHHATSGRREAAQSLLGFHQGLRTVSETRSVETLGNRSCQAVLWELYSRDGEPACGLRNVFKRPASLLCNWTYADKTRATSVLCDGRRWRCTGFSVSVRFHTDIIKLHHVLFNKCYHYKITCFILWPFDIFRKCIWPPDTKRFPTPGLFLSVEVVESCNSFENLCENKNCWLLRAYESDRGRGGGGF